MLVLHSVVQLFSLLIRILGKEIQGVKGLGGGDNSAISKNILALQAKQEIGIWYIPILLSQY